MVWGGNRGDMELPDEEGNSVSVYFASYRAIAVHPVSAHTLNGDQRPVKMIKRLCSFL